MLVEKKFSKTSLLSIQAINIIFLFDIFCTFILFLAKTATFSSKYCSAVLRENHFLGVVGVCLCGWCVCVCVVWARIGERSFSDRIPI